MSEIKIYAAYGSNINADQMKVRCPRSHPVGRGYIEGYQLEFRRVATIVPKRGRRVPVLLWALDPADEATLDVYEGHPAMYRKETVTVTGLQLYVSSGDILSALVRLEDGSAGAVAMVYVMNYGLPEAPSAGYLAAIREGYETYGFHVRYLLEAERRAAKPRPFRSMDESEHWH